MQRFTRREFVYLAGSALSAARGPSLSQRWEKIVADSDGVVGVAALDLHTGAHASINGDESFPLASVCKLPIAMNLLSMVDETLIGIDSDVEVIHEDVVTNVSEISERWPRQRRFPLSELIRRMISASDNTAVETLYRIGGGAPEMAKRFQQWGIAGIRVDRSERQCGQDASGGESAMRRFIDDPRDTATPDATVQMLQRLFAGQLLSASSTRFAVRCLEACATGGNRIRALLPQGTVVADKTGTTATAPGGLNGGTNDVGVIGNKLALAIYIKASRRDLPIRERIIARLAEAAWNS